MRKLTQQNFLDRAIATHGNKYDYSKVEYRDFHSKVTIICPVHGEFQQVAHVHLGGHGCPSDTYTDRNGLRIKAAGVFLEKASRLRPEYDFSRSVYVTSKSKIEVICKEHGPFFTIPSSILAGKGCRKCAVRLINEGRKRVDYKKMSSKVSASISRLYAEGRLKPRRGATSNWWKGGVSSLNSKLRVSKEAQGWRRAVLARDKYTCQKCGKVGGPKTTVTLEIDHYPYPWHKYPEYRYDVNNGRTLCSDCHYHVTYITREWAAA